MKHLIKSSFVVLSLTLTGLVAEARTPAVGEKSVYAVNLARGSQTADGHMSLELTAFDPAADSWTLMTVTEFNGQKQSKSAATKTADLLDDATIDNIIGNCEASGGKSESVTVAAGTFPTCAMPVSDSDSTGTVWIAKVPFGYAKWMTQRSDGMVVNGALESFVPVAK